MLKYYSKMSKHEEFSTQSEHLISLYHQLSPNKIHSILRLSHDAVGCCIALREVVANRSAADLSNAIFANGIEPEVRFSHVDIADFQCC